MFNIGYRGANTQGEEYTIVDKCKFAEHRGFYFLVIFKGTKQYQWVEGIRVKTGKFKDFSKPFLYGVGYATGTKADPFRRGYGDDFKMWESMMQRCYYKGGARGYKNVYVTEEWHDYKNFKKWYKQNLPKGTNAEMVLDKDLFSDSSVKYYSPKTCCIIPNFINSSITGLSNERFDAFGVKSMLKILHTTEENKHLLTDKTYQRIKYLVNCYFERFEKETGKSAKKFISVDDTKIETDGTFQYNGKVYRFLNLMQLKGIIKSIEEDEIKRRFKGE